MQTPNEKSSAEEVKARHAQAKEKQANRNKKDDKLSGIAGEIERLREMGVIETSKEGSRTRTIERGGKEVEQTVTRSTISDEIDRFATISQQIKNSAVSDLAIKDALESIQLVASALDTGDMTASERKSQVANLDVAEKQLNLTDISSLPEDQQESYKKEANKVRAEIKNFRDLAEKGTQDYSATKEFISQQKDDAMALVIGKLTNNPLLAVGYKLFSDFRKAKKKQKEVAQGRLEDTRRSKVSTLEEEKTQLNKVEDASKKVTKDTKKVSDVKKEDIKDYEIILPLDKNKKFIDAMRESIETGIRQTFKLATGEEPKVIPEQVYTDMFNDREFITDMADATLQAIKEGDVVVEGKDAETFKLLLDSGLYQNELTEKMVEGFLGENFSEMFPQDVQRSTPSAFKSESVTSSSGSIQFEKAPDILYDIKSDTGEIKVLIEKLVGNIVDQTSEAKKSRVVIEKADKRAQENERESKRGNGFTAKDYVKDKVQKVKDTIQGLYDNIRNGLLFVATIPDLITSVGMMFKGFITAIAPLGRILASFAKRIFPILAIFKGVYDAWTGWADTEGEDMPVRILSVLKDLAGGILSFFTFGLVDGDTLESVGKFISDGLFDIFKDGGMFDKLSSAVYDGLKKIPIVGSILSVFEKLMEWWKSLDIVGAVKRFFTGEKKETNTTTSASVDSARESGALEGTDEIEVKDADKLKKLSKYRLKSILKSQNLTEDTRKQIESLLEAPKRKPEPALDRAIKPISTMEDVKREAYSKSRGQDTAPQSTTINNYNTNNSTLTSKSVPVTSPLDSSARVQSDYL